MSHFTTAVLSPPSRRVVRVERWFYIGIGLMMILLNVAAFAPSIVDPSRRNVPLPLTPLVTLHALLGVAWLLMFLTQATLVATGRRHVHRRMGIFGALLALAFVVVGGFAVLAQARRGFDLSGDISRLAPPGTPADPPALAGLLFFFATFAALVCAALLFRHRPDVHKRLMLLAMLGGLSPTPVAHVIGHWPLLQPYAGMIFPTSLFVFLSLSAIHDRVSYGRVHPVSVWIGLLVFVWISAFNVAIIPSAAWRQFAAWLLS